MSGDKKLEISEQEVMCLVSSAATILQNYKQLLSDGGIPLASLPSIKSARQELDLRTSAEVDEDLLLNMIKRVGAITQIEAEWIKKFATLGRLLVNALEGKELGDAAPMPPPNFGHRPPTTLESLQNNVRTIEALLPVNEIHKGENVMPQGGSWVGDEEERRSNGITKADIDTVATAAGEIMHDIPELFKSMTHESARQISGKFFKQLGLTGRSLGSPALNAIGIVGPDMFDEAAAKVIREFSDLGREALEAVVGTLPSGRLNHEKMSTLSSGVLTICSRMLRNISTIESLLPGRGEGRIS